HKRPVANLDGRRRVYAHAVHAEVLQIRVVGARNRPRQPVAGKGFGDVVGGHFLAFLTRFAAFVLIRSQHGERRPGRWARRAGLSRRPLAAGWQPGKRVWTWGRKS
nr:hypothetical protein [Tanacetum cinerariifolium]